MQSIGFVGRQTCEHDVRGGADLGTGMRRDAARLLEFGER